MPGTTYPLALPSTAQFKRFAIRRNPVADRVESPFTYQGQTFLWTGDRWEGEITLIPMKRADYDAWSAFFAALDGPVGTFLMGHPLAVSAKGSAASVPGTPLVNGAGQTGEQLVIDGLPLSAPTYFKAGDHFNLGTGSTTRLHMVTQDVASNGSGQATLTVRPRIRTAPADNAPLVVASPKGIWSLVSVVPEWAIDETGVAPPLTFAVREPR